MGYHQLSGSESILKGALQWTFSPLCSVIYFSYDPLRTFSIAPRPIIITNVPLRFCLVKPQTPHLMISSHGPNESNLNSDFWIVGFALNIPLLKP